MSDEAQPQSSIILYQTENGRTRIQCRFDAETLWLTQAQIAELFQTTPQNVTLHLKTIFAEGELSEAVTCKDYLQVRAEGGREISRKLRHYRLEAILAVGYRVRSHRGTQFRQWATARLSEYLVKGFTMDDERLKNPPGKGHKDYFDEQLERIRDIRSSERRFYQKVLDRKLAARGLPPEWSDVIISAALSRSMLLARTRWPCGSTTALASKSTSVLPWKVSCSARSAIRPSSTRSSSTRHMAQRGRVPVPHQP